MSDQCNRGKYEKDIVTQAAELCPLCMADEIASLRSQLASARKAGNQALRQWKMYAESVDPDDDFERSAEGSVYLACKAALTDEKGNS